jgi:hypothetical protein
MKAVAVIVLVIVCGLAVHFANGASIGNRPTATDAKNWIPVSDRLGFVVDASGGRLLHGSSRQRLAAYHHQRSHQGSG